MRARMIDNGEVARRQAIANALAVQAKALEVTIDVVTDDGSPLEPGDVVVYLGVDRAPITTAAQQRTLVGLAGQDGRVLPVLAEAEHARRLPTELQPINALIEARYGSEWPEAVADEVVSRAFLRRTARRVFISYRRCDSQAIARQLWEALVKLGFDVFLDEVSTEPTVDFQRALMAWLIDADLVIVLASPRFSSSSWTVREIAMAGSAGLGLLCVGWPAEVYGAAATLAFGNEPKGTQPRPMVYAGPGRGTASLGDETIDLGLPDLVHPRGLTVAAALETNPDEVELVGPLIARIVGAVLRTRALAVRLRLESLLTTARMALAEEFGGSVTDAAELGDLEVGGAEGRMLVRVVPFRPSAVTLQRVWRDAGPGNYATAGLYYGEVEHSAPEAEALHWLAEGIRAEPPTKTVVFREVGGKVKS